MTRGRKAEAGTYEARKYVLDGCLDRLFADEKDLSNEVVARIIKAVKFGLGIKEEKIIDSDPNHHKTNCECEYCQDGQKENTVPIIEKKTSQKENLDNSEGDEYFKPEDCKEVGY